MSSLYVSTSLFSTIKKVPLTNVVYEVNITTACFIYKCSSPLCHFYTYLYLQRRTLHLSFFHFKSPVHTDGDYNTNKQLIWFSGISTFMPQIFSQLLICSVVLLIAMVWYTPFILMFWTCTTFSDVLNMQYMETPMYSYGKNICIMATN